jgi:hypothetical protein
MADTSYCPFVVGQHVVCVDDYVEPRYSGDTSDRPIVGRIYTVTMVGIGALSGELGVQLAEISRSPSALSCGLWGYRASRFRPAPSIAALKDIAVRAPSREMEHSHG